MEVVSCLSTKIRTAAIEAVHPKDVRGTHPGGSADGDIAVGDGKDGRHPVPREGEPVVQYIHRGDEGLCPPGRVY